MALHIFNLSIDAPDAQPESIAEDLSVNDIESVTELVLEKLLMIENAIPESDEKDTDDGSPLEIKKIEFFTNKIELIPLNQITANLSSFSTLQQDAFLKLLYYDITTPPPQA